ncbi:hypothetical protein DNX69_10435 [Rhodopseudomonas palustris]|uniref:GNAT family N-acetyltransferase n=1 Tax=Rhodopseudomonas palustris TaxID=1076 RepID=A0A323UHC4_RHOPL|nr:hypothetical protein [Rhodopseudomonas palustris]PZA12392.1 hypothetical protein DNX69_10435 [Rhodopseudomonas palustris]
MQTLDLLDYFRVDFDAPEPPLLAAPAPWPPAAALATEPGIVIMLTDEDRQAAWRLNRRSIGAIGDLTPATERADRTAAAACARRSLVLIAARQQRMLATVRLVRAADADHEAGVARLLEAAAPDELSTLVLHVQFAMLAERPARAMIVPLFRQAYRSAMLAGARSGLIAAAPSLRDLLLPFGWRRTGACYRDPIAGEVEILRLDLFEFDRLRAVDSPLSSVARDLLNSAERRLYDAR